MFSSLLERVLSAKGKDNVLSETSDQCLLDFCKAALKCGIGEDNALLGTLATVVSEVQNKATLQTVLSMLLSHSQSMPILLGHEDEKKGTNLFTLSLSLFNLFAVVGILRLLDTLTDANTSLINSKHVPVLLGAYQASLTCGDQIIFKVTHNFLNFFLRLSTIFDFTAFDEIREKRNQFPRVTTSSLE
jgi:hypothetical protein